MIPNNFSQPLHPLSFVDDAISQPSAIPLSSTGCSSGFDGLTVLLGASERDVLLWEIAHLRDVEQGIEQVVTLAYSHDYHRAEEFFLSSDFELYAFAAVKEGKLSAMQFGTLMLVRASLSEEVGVKDFEVVPLFSPGGAVSTEAWHQIEETAKTPFTDVKTLGKEALARFFEIMRSLPQSEQSYLLIPDTRSFDTGKWTISQAVNRNVCFSMFCGVTVRGEKKRMLFSLGMAQAFLDATSCSDPLLLKFLVKCSTPESLRLSMINDNAREFYIHTTRFPAPLKADSFDAPPLDFMYHDFYHGYACSCIPRTHRLFYSQLASLFNPDLYEGKVAKQEAQCIYETLIDLDFSKYRPDLYKKEAKEESKTVSWVLSCTVELILPWRREEISYSEQEREEARILARVMESLMAGLVCLWMLYHKSYKDFQEIVDGFKSLPSDVQFTLGGHFTYILNEITHCSFVDEENKLRRLLTLEELAQYKPEEMAGVRRLVDLGQFALFRLMKHVHFRDIFNLKDEYRELVVSNYVFISELFEHGITLSELLRIDKEVFRLILEKSFLVSEWLKQGMSFSDIVMQMAAGY